LGALIGGGVGSVVPVAGTIVGAAGGRSYWAQGLVLAVGCYWFCCGMVGQSIGTRNKRRRGRVQLRLLNLYVSHCK